MSAVDSSEKKILPSEKHADIGYEIPLPPTDLPVDDGVPLETDRHRCAMNALIRSLKQTWSERTDFFAGGNMFVYYSSAQARNQDFRGPDFFVVLDIDGSYSRQSWIAWEEGGRYPDVIVELLSPSTEKEDFGLKKELYRRVFKTRDYFVFDPFNSSSLQGWHLDSNDEYQQLVPNEQGWLWSEKLGLWLGTWEGRIEAESTVWLRFYDQTGQLVLLPEEAAQQQAQQAQQQAQQAQQQAQQAQQQAQQAQQRVEELEAMLAEYRQRFGELPE